MAIIFYSDPIVEPTEVSESKAVRFSMSLMANPIQEEVRVYLKMSEDHNMYFIHRQRATKIAPNPTRKLTILTVPTEIEIKLWIASKGIPNISLLNIEVQVQTSSTLLKNNVVLIIRS